MQQARIYAVDFVSQAKKYDGEYVGGDINVYSIEDHNCGQLWPAVDGGTAIVREGRRTRMITTGMDTWEREISRINSAFDEFFRALTDPNEQPSLSSLSGWAKIFRSWSTGKSTQGDHS